MRYIKNKTFKFFDFYKELTHHLAEGKLSNLTIENCVIDDIPSSYPLYEIEQSKKFLGLTIVKLNDRFCGFVCQDLLVKDNIFKRIK